MRKEDILKIQLVWTAVVYGILFSILVGLFNQNFSVSRIQLFGATVSQPQIFVN